jgi:hypothetical protein
MNKSYYAVIPAGVRYDNDLTANAKLMYGEITALTNEKGYCYGTNKYFAELYKVSTVSISKWIKQLNEKSYIRIKYIYFKDTTQIKERRIYIATPLKKSLIPPQRKVNDPLKEKFKVINNISNNNNIYNNNNINNNSVKSKNREFSELVVNSLEPISKLFPEKARPKNKAQKDTWLECIDKLDRLDGYNPRKVYFICKKVRQDSFWKDNFLSILKLRKNDNSGVKYIIKFEQRFAKELEEIGL